MAVSFLLRLHFKNNTPCVIEHISFNSVWCSSKCSCPLPSFGCPKTGISEDQYLTLLHDDSEFFHGWFFAMLEYVNAHTASVGSIL